MCNVFQLPGSPVEMGHWPTVEGWVNGRVSKKVLFAQMNHSRTVLISFWGNRYERMCFICPNKVLCHHMSVHICMHTKSHMHAHSSCALVSTLTHRRSLCLLCCLLGYFSIFFKFWEIWHGTDENKTFRFSIILVDYSIMRKTVDLTGDDH